jgi:AraC-like DNA-binding protein
VGQFQGHDHAAGRQLEKGESADGAILVEESIQSPNQAIGHGQQPGSQGLRLLLGVTALESGQSVTSVAMDSGYDSVPAYIAAFRRQSGRTPGRWVKEFAAPRAGLNPFSARVHPVCLWYKRFQN